MHMLNYLCILAPWQTSNRTDLNVFISVVAMDAILLRYPVMTKAKQYVWQRPLAYKL